MTNGLLVNQIIYYYSLTCISATDKFILRFPISHLPPAFQSAGKYIF